MDSSSTKPEVRVIDGWCGNPDAAMAFVVCQTKTFEDEVPCSLVIGDKAVPLSVVVEMVNEIHEYLTTTDFWQEDYNEILKKYGITL